MTAPPGSVMLVPEAGFCFRGVRNKWTEAGGKVFVNICSHPRIDPSAGRTSFRLQRNTSIFGALGT